MNRFRRWSMSLNVYSVLRQKWETGDAISQGWTQPSWVQSMRLNFGLEITVPLQNLLLRPSCFLRTADLLLLQAKEHAVPVLQPGTPHFLVCSQLDRHTPLNLLNFLLDHWSRLKNTGSEESSAHVTIFSYALSNSFSYLNYNCSCFFEEDQIFLPSLSVLLDPMRTMTRGWMNVGINFWQSVPLPPAMWYFTIPGFPARQGNNFNEKALTFQKEVVSLHLTCRHNFLLRDRTARGWSWRRSEGEAFFPGLVPHFCNRAEDTQLSSHLHSQRMVLKESQDGVQAALEPSLL